MAYCTCPRWLRWWRIWCNEDWQGKPKFSEKTCPSATLSTTNPTWPDPGSNPSRRGGKPATNRLSYGAAHSTQYDRSIKPRTHSFFVALPGDMRQNNVFLECPHRGKDFHAFVLKGLLCDTLRNVRCWDICRRGIPSVLKVRQIYSVALLLAQAWASLLS
jgi:hypothetical protein